MRRYLIGIAVLCLSLANAPAQAITTHIGTFKGVATGFDGTGVFGAANSKFTYDVSVQLFFDFSNPDSNDDTSSFKLDAIDKVIFQMNGVTKTFSPNGSTAQQYDLGWMPSQATYGGNEIVTFAGATAKDYSIDITLGGDDFLSSAKFGTPYGPFDDSWGLFQFTNVPAFGVPGVLEAATGSFTLTEASIAAVPEPATWGMMVVGLAGIGGMLRTRRRAMPGALAAA